MQRLRSLVFLCLAVLSIALWAQDTSSAAQTPQGTSSASTSTQEQGSQQQTDSTTAPRGKGLKKHLKDHFSSWCVGAPVNNCYEKTASGESQADQAAQNPQPGQAPRRDAPVSSDGESSSKDTMIDLSPPPGDATDHPGTDVTGPSEFHKWDPHKAAKNIEVGDYYFKQKNYRAAESRYREGLEWKPGDAEATYKLALALEKQGKKQEARTNFEEYLKILPKGPRAPEAREALARLR